MMNRKKKILTAIACCIIIVIIILVIIVNLPMRCLKIQSDNMPVTVTLYSEQSYLDSFLSPAFMGQSYDYEIVLRKKGLFGSELLRRSFTFSNDGAPIHDYNVSIDSENNNAIIIISGSEMHDKTFEVQLD